MCRWCRSLACPSPPSRVVDVAFRVECSRSLRPSSIPTFRRRSRCRAMAGGPLARGLAGGCGNWCGGACVWWEGRTVAHCTDTRERERPREEQQISYHRIRRTLGARAGGGCGKALLIAVTSSQSNCQYMYPSLFASSPYIPFFNTPP